MTSPPSWQFAHVSDMHIGTPRSYRFQPAWNENWQTAKAQLRRLDPSYLLVGGDLTRDGATHSFELEQAKAELADFDCPIGIIPGNHEVGNKYRAGHSVSINPAYLERYRSVFGPSQWSRVFRNVQFSAFDAFLCGSGLPGERALWRWLEQLERDPQVDHHVWIMHPALFADRVDEPNWDPATDRAAWYFALDEPHRSRLLAVFRRTRANLVISGHIHCRRQVRVGEITFQFAPATAFPQWGDRWADGDDRLGFLHFTVTPEAIRTEFFPLERVSTAQGYGPGGNPPEDDRDYTVAWEQPPLR